LRNKYTYLDNSTLRILAVAIGWNITENICSNFFYFILNASGDEFTWRYIVRAVCCNFDLLETFCVVGLMVGITRQARKTGSLFGFENLIAFILASARSVIYPTVISYFANQGRVSEENETLPILKGVLSVSLYISCKVIGAV